MDDEWRLYTVRLGFDGGVEREYTCSSRLGLAKAVAMAVEAYHFPGALPPREPVRRVDVADLGPTPIESGFVGAGPPGTLEDRAEF